MRKLVLAQLLVALVSLAGSFTDGRAGQPRETKVDEKALLEVVQRFDRAWNRADAEAVAALFSADGELVSPSGAITSARDEIRNLLAGEFQDTLRGTTITTKVDATKFVSDDAALAKGKFTLANVYVFWGWKTSVNGSFIFRIRRTDGRWMVEKAYILRS